MEKVPEMTEKQLAGQTAINKLNLAVRDLIKSMNSASDFNITIVNEDTKSSWFEFSLEYPPYEDSPQKFQRRVSNIEAKDIARRIFYSIKDLFGYNYNEDRNYVASEVESFSDQVYYEKQFQFTIGFIEKR